MVARWAQDESGQWWYHVTDKRPNSRTRGIVRKCEACGIDFPALPKSLNRFCSRQCSASVAEHNTDKRADRYFQDEAGAWWYRLANGSRTRAAHRTCEACGSEFLVRIGGNAGRGQYCSRACANKAIKPRRNRRGSDHPNWKGGHVTKEGYRVIYVDGKLVLEHRHVIAEHLGRPLTTAETVHHKNGDKADNRIENLEVWRGRHPKGQREAHCPTCTCFSH